MERHQEAPKEQNFRLCSALKPESGDISFPGRLPCYAGSCNKPGSYALDSDPVFTGFFYYGMNHSGSKEEGSYGHRDGNAGK